MASAVLASRNEPYWGERKVYMRKHPNATANNAVVNSSYNSHNNTPIFTAKSNANPNHNSTSKSNSNKQIQAHDSSNDVDFRKTTRLAMFGNFPLKETSRAGHVTFNLCAYTRPELEDLKKRLLSELDQVRILRIRIENTKFDAQPIYPAAPPVQVSYATNPQKPNSNLKPKGRKKGTGSKRANPFNNSGQNSKQKRPAMDLLMRSCGQILTKLMKHKFGWVFNSPVDALSLGLHDYHEIIKKPMDLGTIKFNLENHLYGTVLDFVSDVRLTFNNALNYNPKGHDVYFMAETLLANFEKMFNPVVRKFGEISVTEASALVGKLRKPKAREMNKRQMSFEEKTVLGRSLVELPQEKMSQLLSILKKTNRDVSHDGDEIELDIEAMDNETLWELDRFVSNYKKAISKGKKQGLIGAAEAEKASGSTVSEIVEVGAVERCKKLEVGVGVDEDVDIGEEIPVENYPPVVIERDVTSSSASYSSSSSGSDSRSSSGRESDDDDDNDSVQSPFVEAKVAHGTSNWNLGV